MNHGLRRTAALTAGVLVACLGAAHPSTASATTTRTAGISPKLRTITTMTAATTKGAAARRAHVSSAARTATSHDRSVTADPGAGLRSAREAGVTAETAPARQGTAATTAAGCATGQVEVNTLSDRVELYFTGLTGTVTVSRLRNGGSWTTIGSVDGGEEAFVDLGVAPEAAYRYRLTVGGSTCEFPSDAGDFLTTWTPDGWGQPDAVVGALNTYFFQNPLSLGSHATSGMGTNDPAFSRDGRRVASVDTLASGRPNPEYSAIVADPRRPSTIIRSAMPTDVLPAHFAFAPDGQSVVYTRYALDPGGSGDLTPLGLWRFDLRTRVDAAIPGAGHLVQADFVSPTTLVSADSGSGTGLYTMPVAGGTPTAVPGTANAAEPEVGPDGTWYWVESDGTTDRLRRRTPAGTITTLTTSTTDHFGRPRVAPDGSLFWYVEHPDQTYDIRTGDPAAPEVTTIGAIVGTQDTSFLGYDVRQPRSKGGSDFAGDANNDLVMRDAAGVLWVSAFRQPTGTSPTTTAPRVRVGGGWNIYSWIGVPGDVDGDDRADVLGRDSAGVLWLYRGRGQAQLTSRTRVGAGWTGFTIVTPGDWNGDGRADLLGRDSAGSLWLYPGRGDGAFPTRVKVGAGWGAFDQVVGVGDFDMDNRPDLVARDRVTHTLRLYPGNGTGGFRANRTVGWGWDAFDVTVGPEFLGVSPNPALYVRTTQGQLVVFDVLGDGRLDAQDGAHLVGSGWQIYNGLTG
jgi:hypothetical protein